MQDELGAFCDDRPMRVEGAPGGTLSGLVFGAKDVFDVRGYRCAAGNPDWLQTHSPAVTTANSVRRLLDAGATLVGKTHTDELTYSLNGENAHYGTPINPAAPGRIPGGSSSGSAAAVAGKLVDFALGTDTGGSVRLPASNCGIFGFRPSHGAADNSGVIPLAPGFDTVGWFTREAGLLERIGELLIETTDSQAPFVRLLIAADAFELVFDEERPALEDAAIRLANALGAAQDISLYGGAESEWMNAFRLLQAAEAWQTHSAWIRAVRPRFGPGIRERFEWASSIEAGSLGSQQTTREKARERLDSLLGHDRVICLPSSPSIARPIGESGEELEHFRLQALTLTCAAGLAGLPQVSLPLAQVNGFPVGLSLLGPRHSDRRLLALASRLLAAI